MTHPIFQQYPLEPTMVQTSVGEQPTPYHVYDGHAVLIGGTADFGKVSELLRGEQVYPVKTMSGKTLMALWAVDESSASHGAHSECQVSFYVSHQEVAPIDDSPVALLKFLLTEPHARQMCHGLWNNTPEVVAYNREILGLSPTLVRSEFNYANGRVAFAFHNDADGELISEGDVSALNRPPLSAGIALFRSFGFRQALRAAFMKTVETRVVNPISDVLPHNADAFTISASDSIVAQLFDPARDQITIHDQIYGSLGFEAAFVEHMRGFKMVYCNPQPITAPRF